MPTLIESREYEQPVWREVTWTILDQRLRLGVSELPGSTELYRKIRIAVPIPNDAQNVSINIQEVEIVHRDPQKPGYQPRKDSIHAYVISYWSPGLKLGEQFIIPRELAEPFDENGPVFVQVQKISVCGFDQNYRPKFTDLL